MDTCPFCRLEDLTLLDENELAVCFRDRYPVSQLHTLVIPRRHIPDVFSLRDDELCACLELLRRAQDDIVRADAEVLGFNLGVNVGAVAGQTVFHCHFHLIPRRPGDVADPTGGVRNVIPGMGPY